MKVCIVGAGYVGLPTGVCLSKYGHSVTILENNPQKLEMLKAGDCPIYEDGLDADGLKCIEFTDDYGTVYDKDIVILAVGTPSKLDGSADLSQIFGVCDKIKSYLHKGQYLAIKSTVPVGTNRRVAQAIDNRCPVISLPEFLREGTAISDFLNQDRIVVGCDDSSAGDVIDKLYCGRNDTTEMVVTNPESAELIKYASNAFLATKIHFANELADLCEQVGASVKSVTTGMGLDKRIGKHFLNAGCGYGGSCFPKDTRALLKISDKASLSIVKTVVEQNVKRQLKIGDRIKDFAKRANVTKIAFWGLAFKGNTDDVRESPALEIIDWVMKDLGLQISVYDPKAMKNSEPALSGRVRYATDEYDCADGAEMLVVLTEWDDFKKVDLSKLNMTKKLIIDYRGIIDRDNAVSCGYDIFTVGEGLKKGKQ